jgi:hypothetical protein
MTYRIALVHDDGSTRGYHRILKAQRLDDGVLAYDRDVRVNGGVTWTTTDPAVADRYRLMGANVIEENRP